MSNGRRQPSCGGTSRMTRECQVRFCERLGVQFPGPTRHQVPLAADLREAASPRSADLSSRPGRQPKGASIGPRRGRKAALIQSEPSNESAALSRGSCRFQNPTWTEATTTPNTIDTCALAGSGVVFENAQPPFLNLKLVEPASPAASCLVCLSAAG
jgi:hypothetical protein